MGTVLLWHTLCVGQYMGRLVRRVFLYAGAIWEAKTMCYEALLLLKPCHIKIFFFV